ncbi:serine/threonine-protein kinase [Cellulomonas marina]|uniref:non-specific serine/threonine protein kinase n=1 Tax=Cellulomonas marina TaxID=988821 RepID=A0A1I0YW19_9CELL|nr:serine/threonine-protein kinase [Cellulomonas marina]GIG27530.1 hypothetical protein Cma02nite_01300 [Cellulomonas marina]SFB16283.1 Serine/threonine protein kinase [Cellulomonas marina]
MPADLSATVARAAGPAGPVVPVEPGPAVVPPVLPGLRFLHSLGRGGSADVLCYEQEHPRRLVAVKVLHAAPAPEVRARFLHEADLAARVSHHPSIVTVHAVTSTEDGRPCLVLEHCPGPSLGDRYRTERLEVPEVLRTGVRLASAVETAHRAGILHRDIKPANVLTTDLGRPVLTDFGIAEHRRAAGAAGAAGLSVPWAPPELLADGSEGDERSDVWSLAATLYSLLAGRSPFEVPGGSNTAVDLVQRIERAALPPTGRADVPPALEAVLARAMNRAPARRHGSALSVAHALQQVEHELGLPVTAVDVQGEDGEGPLVLPTSARRAGAAAGPVRTSAGLPAGARVSDPVAAPVPVPLPQPRSDEDLPDVTRARALRLADDEPAGASSPVPGAGTPGGTSRGAPEPATRASADAGAARWRPRPSAAPAPAAPAPQPAPHASVDGAVDARDARDAQGVVPAPDGLDDAPTVLRRAVALAPSAAPDPTAPAAAVAPAVEDLRTGPEPAPAAAAGAPAPATTRRRPRRLTRAGALTAVVVLVGLGVASLLRPPGSGPDGTGDALTAPADGGLRTEVVPAPSGLSGEVLADGTVRWTWTREPARDGDFWQWAPVDGSAAPVVVTEPVALVPASAGPCVTVSLVRVDRQASASPAVACAP